MNYFKFSIMGKSWLVLLLFFAFNCSNPKKDVASSPEATGLVGDPADSERVWELIEASKVTNPNALRSEVETTAPEADWWAPEGTVPYLVLQGMLDKSAPPQNAELLKQELGSRVTIVELPDLGHLAAAEDPAQVAAAIVSYSFSNNK